MRFSALILLLFICSLKSFSQYKGGSNDGVSQNIATNQNALPSIYTGGVNDGVTIAATLNSNPTPSIYSGGVNDGVASAASLNNNPVPAIYTGGVNDGATFNSISNQNPITNIYLGGINDGVAVTNILNSNPAPDIYLGGINDGVAAAVAVNKNPLPGIYSGGINDGYAITISLNQNSPSGGPLPVSLLYFAGAWSDHNAILDWETGIETSLDHFELERSDDGGANFNFISSVTPNTQTNSHNYRYSDTKAYNLPVTYFYYRLKSIDKNGGYKYSAIIRLAKEKTAPIIIAYPNPTTGQFTLSLSNIPNLSGYSYILTSTEGRIIKKELIRQTSTSFNLAALPAAIYHLSVYKDRDLLQHFAIVLSH